MDYDMLVYFKVNAPSEDEGIQKLNAFLRMAKLDFGLTYGIEDSELVEFVASEPDNI